MNESTRKQMLSELKALLEKYNFDIGFTCSECSDTHGLSDDHLIITDNATNERVVDFGGWWITSGSIDDALSTN